MVASSARVASAAAAIANALLYVASLAVYRRVLGDVADDGAPACAGLLEVPARDVQRVVDDLVEADGA